MALKVAGDKDPEMGKKDDLLFPEAFSDWEGHGSHVPVVASLGFPRALSVCQAFGSLKCGVVPCIEVVPYSQSGVGSGSVSQVPSVAKASRGRGRPKKVEKRGRKQDLAAARTEVATTEVAVEDIDSTGRELMLFSSEFFEPRGVLTRARSALLMGHRLGLVHDCTDDVALNQIAAQILARRRS